MQFLVNEGSVCSGVTLIYAGFRDLDLVPATDLLAHQVNPVEKS